MEIVEAQSRTETVIVALNTPEGRPFFMKVGSDGVSFHSDRNSAGSLTDKPIVKSDAYIYSWIQGEAPPGGRKTFGERVRLQPKIK